VARPNRQAQRREEILDAAIALIERHDLATLRLADIAAELEITPQAVRYYFKDMHQLLSELALRSDVRFYDDRLAVVEHTKDVRQQLALTIGSSMPIATAQPGCTASGLSSALGPPPQSSPAPPGPG
jgi:AcrR family transcriptional regulator